MTFWQALKSTYGDSIAFLIACPLLALIPVAFEIIQHVVEVHIGMYDSIAAAKATEHHPLRMAFGLLKVAALIVPIYWITRFLPDRDSRHAATLAPRAARRFAAFAAFELAMAALQLFALPQTGPAILGGFVGGEIVGALLVAWGVAASLGNPAIGPLASIRIMAPQLLWTIALGLAAMLPLMLPHYAFGALALLGPRALLWPVLIVDALLVGWLTAVLVASGYYAAVRAAGRAGVDLAVGGRATGGRAGASGLA